MKPNLANIPDELRATDRWLAWRATPKPGGGIDKVPTAPWRSKPVNFAWACRRLEMINGNGGIGYIFTEDDDVGGVDLDCCRDPASGDVITDWARNVLQAFGPTYAEVSPSTTGIKLWAHGCPIAGIRKKRLPGVAAGGHDAPAIEAFGTRGFFTVTGNLVPGAPRTLASAEQAAAGWAMVVELLGHDDGQPDDDGPAYDPSDLLDAKELAHVLAALDVRNYRSAGWVPLLCASLHTTGNARGAMDAFVDWSAGDPEFDSEREIKNTRRRWRSFSRATPVGRRYGVGTLLWCLDRESPEIAFQLRRFIDVHEQWADTEWQTDAPRLAATDATVHGDNK